MSLVSLNEAFHLYNVGADQKEMITFADSHQRYRLSMESVRSKTPPSIQLREMEFANKCLAHYSLIIALGENGKMIRKTKAASAGDCVECAPHCSKRRHVLQGDSQGK